MLNRFVNILMFFASLIYSVCVDAQEASITTNFDFVNKEMQYTIKINGVDVSQSDKTFLIPTNEFGFDSIMYSFNNSPMSWAVMRLRENVDYELGSNSCSFYTLRPKNQAKQGMIQFRIDGQDSTEYLVGMDGSGMRKLNRQQIDEFYYTPPSAMCPFAAKSIEVQSMERKVLKQIRFHFLHGELVGVRYCGSNNEISLDLYGDIRDERDYRYHYQVPDD